MITFVWFKGQVRLPKPAINHTHSTIIHKQYYACSRIHTDICGRWSLRQRYPESNTPATSLPWTPSSYVIHPWTGGGGPHTNPKKLCASEITFNNWINPHWNVTACFMCVRVCAQAQLSSGIIIMEPKGSVVTVVALHHCGVWCAAGLEFHLEAVELGWLWQQVAVATVHYGL